jgi:ferritin-like metal-binding protein YciE
LALVLSALSQNPKYEATMPEKTLENLFHDALKDIYHAERKILKALPKMARAANPNLKPAEIMMRGDERDIEREQIAAVRELIWEKEVGKG